jgi:hypothetical protein|tara:strand:- start:450 stop:635 length:186 start_codon:yes stop_codon:yes gene_type:complete
MDEYLYYETDAIEEIFFLTKGSCGFVLPLAQNVVYIKVINGDYVGDLDFVFPAKQHKLEFD